MNPSASARLRLNAGAAVAAVAAQTLIGLVLYSFLIRQLGAETVGAWVSLTAVGLLACMADMGLNHALIRQLSVAIHQADQDRVGATVETLVWAVAVFAGAALGLLYLAFPLWSPWLGLPAVEHAGVERWLPFVFGGLWLNRMGDACAGGLDGQQRFVARSVAVIFALLAGLLLSLWWVPLFGMDGAAAAFVVQNALQFIANLVQLRRTTNGLSLMRPRLRVSILREAVRYGLSVQALVLCYLVLESGIKISLARSGNLAAVSYFDLAFRIGKGVRGLLASALRVLVPRLAAAGSDASGQERRAAAYADAFGVLLMVALSAFVVLLAAAPLISWLVVGRVEPVFMSALAFALLPWLVYSLTDPALTVSLASARMRWPLRGHLVTLLLTAVLVALGGRHTPFVGLYAIVMFAMLSGCVVTWVGIHRDEELRWRSLHPSATAAAVLGGAAVGLFGLMAPTLLAGWPLNARVAVVVVVVLVWLALLGWLHPAARAMRAHAAVAGRRSAPPSVRRRRA